MENKKFDVIIVGGSYSGLAAAMTLGRSNRSTLVIDSGKPCNRFTPHSQNFLTRDGDAPAEIAAVAKSQVAKYPMVRFLDDLVISGKQIEAGFLIETVSGQQFQSSKLVFATGIKDLLPEIDGFADCWGKTIIHCPYCHGYEFRDQKTAIWVNADNAWHLAPLVHNLTKDLTLITNGEVLFNAEEKKRLTGKGIAIIEKKIAGFNHQHGQLQSLTFADSSAEKFDALYAGLAFEQHCQVPAVLGCELTEKGYIKTDQFFQTTFEGIYACGDNVSPFRSVANAVANGNFTGAAINREFALQSF